MIRLLLVAFFLISFPFITLAQFTSVQDGNWNDGATWGNTSPGVAGVDYPSTGNSATINSNVTVDATSSVNNLNIPAGWILTIASTGTLNLSGILDIEDDMLGGLGFVDVDGSLVANQGSSFINDSDQTVSINFGGVYRHNFTTTAGNIIAAFWDTGSSCLVAGYTTNTTPPGNLNQSFFNFTWNGQNFTAGGANGFIDLNGEPSSVAGDFTIQNTGNSLRTLRFFNDGNNLTMTIDGSLIVEGSSRLVLSSTGINNVLNVGADFVINNSALSPLHTFCSTGSVEINVVGGFSVSSVVSTTINFTNGSGVTEMNVTGDFSSTPSAATTISLASANNASGSLFVAGDFSINASTTLSRANNATLGLVRFNGTNQSYINTGATFSNNALTFEVAIGATLDLGTSALGRASNVFVCDGTVLLGSTNPTGAIVGNIPPTTRTFNSGSALVYNGIAAQFMGATQPAGASVSTVILNPAGVSIAAADASVTVGGILNMQSGFLSIGNNKTLVLGGTIVGTGTITGGATSNLTINGTGPLGTVNFTNNPETLGTLTLSRGGSPGSMTLGTGLTIGTSFNQVNGDLDFSNRTLTINGAYSHTNGNLLSNSSSILIIGNSGALPANVPFSGGLALNTLTMSRAATTFATNASLLLTNLNLTSGTVNNTGTLTMASGGIVTRSAGILTSPLSAVTSYNVLYDNSGPISSGPELPSGPILLTGLNNLTKQNTGTLTLSAGVTINGILTFSGPGFDAGVQSINLRGNLISNGASVLTSSNFTFSGTTTISGGTNPVFGNVNVFDINSTLNPGTNFQINGNLVNNGTLNTTTGTVTFGGSTTVSGTQPTSFANVIIGGTLIGPVFPNSQIMNVSGTWTNNGVFTAGSGGAGSTIVFNGTSTIGGTNPTTFNNVTVSGALTAPTTLTLVGNFVNNGTFTASNGTVVLAGTALQTIGGTTATTFNNINVTNNANPLSVRVSSNQNLAGILTLASNTIFDADGASGTAVFTLLSSSDQPAVIDAAIAALPTGAQVIGNVTVQRYMSIEGTNGRMYRYITSPIQGATVADLQNEIPITGSFATSSTCSGCGTNQSMFLYNEAETGDTNGGGGNTIEDGYEDFPQNSSGEALTSGRGYALFVRGNVAPVSGAGNARWDLTGPINSGLINFVATSAISYTSTGVPGNDGWNLIGNPFPSTIDWNAAGWSRSASVNNAIYMRDNGSAAGTYASYVNGVPANGGSRYIPIGQAFWVKLNSNAGITLTADESVKAPGNSTEFFREATKSDLLRITLRQGELRDETVIYFDKNATAEFDSQLDALKLDNAIFNLFTTAVNGTRFAINAVPELDCSFVTDLQLSNIEPGSYTLDFTEFESFNSLVEITLRDKELNIIQDISSNPSFQFQVTTEESSFKDRFELSIMNKDAKKELIAVAKGAQGCNESTVTLIAEGAPSGGRYLWYESMDAATPIAEENGSTFITPKLKESTTYFVAVASAKGCQGERTAVTAEIMNFADASIQVEGNTLISNYESGNKWLLDGVEIPGAIGQSVEASKSGIYTLVVTTGDCTTSSERSFIVTDIEERWNKGIHVYPNSFKDKFTVEVESSIPIHAKVFSIMGVMVAEQSLKGSDSVKTGEFDLTGSADGMYILYIHKGDAVQQVKIIKSTE